MKMIFQLAEDLGVEEGSQVLLGVFSPAVGMSSEPQGRSGLCVYSLQHVDTLFDQVRHNITKPSPVMDQLSRSPLSLSEYPHVLQRLHAAPESALHLRPVR